MATLIEDITKVLLQTRDEIQANMAAHGINASGRSSRAFRVVRTENGLALVYGSDERIAPLDTLEIGRPAGGVPGGFVRICKTGKYKGKPDVSNWFKIILMRWAAEKGLTDFGWGAATNLGRKIAYEGTDRNKRPVDVWSTPVNMAVERLRADIRANIATQISQTITNF